jgi:hypothetical protein
MSNWTLTVESDPDDPECLMLDFPEDLLERTGWVPGDTLTWIDNGDGTWTIKKAEHNE